MANSLSSAFMLRSNLIPAVVLACLVGTLFAGTARAEEHLCTTTEGRLALEEAVTLRSWGALYRSFKKFGHCDDGAIAEGYSESVARILADHWNTLPRFVELAAKNATFRAFVLRHLDATLNTDDLEKIEKSASARCPANLGKTCSDLAKQADQALKEP
jgi:hypothetical protein